MSTAPPHMNFSEALSRAARSTLLSLAILFTAALAAASAAAAPVTYNGNSADGKVAIFSTQEQMVPGDTDQEEDVYVRALDSSLGEYLTREVSIGPKGGNDTLPAHYDGISSYGTEVFFSTREPLVADDGDHKEDVYVRNLVENRTILASQGDTSCAAQSCGNGEVDASFASDGVAPEGDRVFFTTTEPLNGADEDGSLDIYVRYIEAQTTVLVSAGDSSCSAGGCGDEGQAVSFRGSDAMGDKAYFTTTESHALEDTDGGEDIYERDLGAERTYLVSVAGSCPENLPADQNCEPSYGGASPDGSHVFFETNERISSGEDTDKSQDVYDWSGGAPALASIGPDGGNGESESIVTYSGTSGDGGTVYFQTSERLDETADTDQARDVYQHSGGTTTLVSAGEAGKGHEAVLAFFNWASTASGPQVAVFSTTESLTTEDTDLAKDVYERSGGVTTLVSTGPEGGDGEIDASFAGGSKDGSKIFFVTAESLVAQDTDSTPDIYVHSGSETDLVSAGQINGNGAYTAFPAGVSDDGSRAFFVTQERLTVDDDFAEETDVYAWSGSGTLLVSVKNSPDLVIGPPPPTLEGTNPASPNPSTTPAVVGQAASGALVKIYKTFNCTGELVAQGTAEELSSPGLTVTVPVAIGSTTNYRATAEVKGIVSVCSSPIAYKQEDPPPPPPPPPPPTGEGTGGTGGAGGSETGSGGGGTGGGGSSSGGTHGGVTYVTPLPRITFGPAAKTRLRRPTFRFVDSTEQPGTRFFCRVDKLRWSRCTSPLKVNKLKPGRHAFSVKAVNTVGTPGPSPVKRKFKVVGG
jgi:hypothetical protein